jgi:hypothetical protein
MGTVKARSGAARGGDGKRGGRVEPASEPISTKSFERVEVWTVARAQAFFGSMAGRLRADLDRLMLIHRGLPRSPDMEARGEGRRALDTTTEILTTIECLEADVLRPALTILERLARVTDEELAQEHREEVAEERRRRRRTKAALAAALGSPPDAPPSGRRRGATP